MVRACPRKIRSYFEEARLQTPGLKTARLVIIENVAETPVNMKEASPLRSV